MKSNLFLIATAGFIASAAAQRWDECIVTQGSTATEYTYAFSIHDLTAPICDSCQTALTAAAATGGVAIESFTCFETPVLAAIGADAVFSILYNNTTPASVALGTLGADPSLMQGITACLPGIRSSFPTCPDPNVSL